ncbi:MAG: hypothetical protein ABI830_04595 [Pseudolabrys sp.]
MTVSKRLVLYVPGFDPRDLAEHFRDFRQDYRRTCELYGLTGKVGDAAPIPDQNSAAWDITTAGQSSGQGWQVETQFRLLRLDDIVAKDLTRPAWWKIVQIYRTTGVAMLTGAFKRILHTNWRFGIFALVPLVLITIWLFLGSFFGVLCMNLIAAMRAPPLVAKTVGVITGLGGFASLLWLTEPFSKLLLRCDQAATTEQLIENSRRDWEQRIDALAGETIDAISGSDADEVVIVGHGLGAILAIEVLGRAMKRDANLGKQGPNIHGPALRLLTITANLPVVGFRPEAKDFRNMIRKLAVAQNVDWVDVQSPDDIYSFCPFDPVGGLDVVLDRGKGKNPTIMTVPLSDLRIARNFDLRRLRPFRTHSQFLRANERPGAAYDYHLICCGPLDLKTRATKPSEAMAFSRQ